MQHPIPPSVPPLRPTFHNRPFPSGDNTFNLSHSLEPSPVPAEINPTLVSSPVISSPSLSRVAPAHTLPFSSSSQANQAVPRTLPATCQQQQRFLTATESAQALVALLQSAEGIKRLNALRPEERQELASKVQAFQKQLLQSGGTQLNAASLAVAALLANKLQDPLQHSSGSSTSTEAPTVQTVKYEQQDLPTSQSLISVQGLPPSRDRVHTNHDPERTSTPAAFLQTSQQQQLNDTSRRSNAQAIKFLLNKKCSEIAALAQQEMRGRLAIQQLHQILSSQQHTPDSLRSPQQTLAAQQQILQQGSPQALQALLESPSPPPPNQLGRLAEFAEHHAAGAEQTVQPVISKELLRRLPPQVVNILKAQMVGMPTSLMAARGKKEKILQEIQLEGVATQHERLQRDQHDRIERALKRKRVVEQSPNSVEAQVWRMRKRCKVEDQDDDQSQQENPRTKGRLDTPLWDGSRFICLRPKNPELADQALEANDFIVSQVATSYWWDQLFDDDRGIVDDEFLSMDLSDDIPISYSTVGDLPIITADGSYDHILDVCILPYEGTIIAPMYPPALVKIPETKNLHKRPASVLDENPKSSKALRIARTSGENPLVLNVTSDVPSVISEPPVPKLWIPNTGADEFAYSKQSNAPDRFLQEVLRGKWYLSNDLDIPIPRTAITTERIFGLQPSDQQSPTRQPAPEPVTTTSSGRAVRSTRRNLYVGDFYYSPTRKNEYDDADAIDFVSTPPAKRRRGARTPHLSPYGFRDAEMSFLQQQQGTGVIEGIPQQIIRSGDVSGETSPSVSGMATPVGGYGSGLDNEVEGIKRKTGWHPYVWYLMCRRPELYDIGIRARLVARVAGWEWDEVQKSPDVLRTFLDRIWAFVEQHPVPKYTEKKEAKEYKNFAATSVRTPWNGQETAAVRRALIEMATSAADTESIASDGGISNVLSAGQKTPAGRRHARVATQPAFMGLAGQVVENYGLRLPPPLSPGHVAPSKPFETASRHIQQGVPQDVVESLRSLVVKITPSTVANASDATVETSGVPDRSSLPSTSPVSISLGTTTAPPSFREDQSHQHSPSPTLSLKRVIQDLPVPRSPFRSPRTLDQHSPVSPVSELSSNSSNQSAHDQAPTTSHSPSQVPLLENDSEPPSPPSGG